MNKIRKHKIVSFVFLLNGFFLLFGCETDIDNKISHLKKSIDSIETVIAVEKAALKPNNLDENVQKNNTNTKGNLSLNIKNEQ
jgi:hypothetical protein